LTGLQRTSENAVTPTLVKPLVKPCIGPAQKGQETLKGSVLLWGIMRKVKRLRPRRA
jgi:hypothetical protein